MSEEPKVTAKDFFQGFPEAPVSDTFKWTDADGFEHMITIRGYAVSAVLKAIAETRAALKEQGGLPQKALPAPQNTIPLTDELGTPVVDGNTGQPATTTLPEGVRLFTVAALVHDQNREGTKDILKVFTVEPPYNKGYGVSCFHPPTPLKGFKAWPLTSKENKNQFAPPDGCGHVLIRDPKGDSKYPDVLEFRA